MAIYAVQSHSRSPISVPIESPYDFLLAINTNLAPILHRFQVIWLIVCQFFASERKVTSL